MPLKPTSSPRTRAGDEYSGHQESGPGFDEAFFVLLSAHVDRGEPHERQPPMLVEIAASSGARVPEKRKVVLATRSAPERGLSVEAKARYHITDDTLAGCISQARLQRNLAQRLAAFKGWTHLPVVVTHYGQGAILRHLAPEIAPQTLDVRVLAKHLWPSLHRNDLYGLYFWLFPRGHERVLRRPRGRCVTEVFALEYVLWAALERFARLGPARVDALHYIARKPYQVDYMPHGPYRGQSLASLPPAYTELMMEYLTQRDDIESRSLLSSLEALNAAPAPSTAMTPG